MQVAVKLGAVNEEQRGEGRRERSVWGVGDEGKRGGGRKGGQEVVG